MGMEMLFNDPVRGAYRMDVDRCEDGGAVCWWPDRYSAIVVLDGARIEQQAEGYGRWIMLSDADRPGWVGFKMTAGQWARVEAWRHGE